MDGFKYIFDDATNAYKELTESKLSYFRFARDIYGFCINEGGRDEQSLKFAKIIDRDLYDRFIQQPKSLIGYQGHEDRYLHVDDLDSKHIFMLTFLFNNFKRDFNKVVEIGAGFGNMLRLVNGIINYAQWDIIDIPHMNELQHYYVKNEINDISKINFINGYSALDYSGSTIELVIGTHSLSELSWDIFYNYFNKVIRHSKYLFISYNKNCPSTGLVSEKINYIKNNGFLLEKNFDYTEKPHGANVSNSLFKNLLIN
jgi:hypothetical protein